MLIHHEIDNIRWSSYACPPKKIQRSAASLDEAEGKEIGVTQHKTQAHRHTGETTYVRPIYPAHDPRQVVAQQGLPFEVRAPNATTIAAMREARSMKKAKFRSAQELFDDLKKAGAGKAGKPAKKQR